MNPWLRVQLRRWERWLPRRLTTRVTLALVIIVVAAGLITTGVMNWLLARSLRAELIASGQALTRAVGENLANSLVEGDLAAVQEALGTVVTDNRDVVYAYAIVPGLPIVHTFPNGFPADLRAALPPAVEVLGDGTLLLTEHGLVRDFGLRPLDGLPIEVHLGFSQARIGAVQWQVTSIVIGLTAAGCLAAAGVAFVFSRIATYPLRELTRRVRRLGKGYLDERIDLPAGDEVGDLAAAFNQMAADLQRGIGQLQRRNRELAALNAVAVAMSGPGHGDPMLDSALHQVLDALELPAGWVFLLDADNATRLVAHVGLSADGLPDRLAASFPACECGQILHNGRPAIVIPQQGCAIWGAQTLDGRPFCCHGSVPLVAGGKVLGVLSVAATVPECFSTENFRVLEAVGRQMGVALENARLWTELQVKERTRAELLARAIQAQEEERLRIARELHDETGQALNALAFGLRAAEAALGGDPDQARTVITRLRGAVGDAVRELQAIIYALRPSLLDDLGLVPALRWWAESRLEAEGVRVVWDVSGEERRLPLPVETALFRIGQEAINNAARYAEARQVRLGLRFDADRVTLEVADDGRGFDRNEILSWAGHRGESDDPRSRSVDAESSRRPGLPERASEANGRGLGLLGMRERAELLGGRLSIESQPGQGTRVWVEIPVETKA